jgi:hypothetical protein
MEVVTPTRATGADSVGDAPMELVTRTQARPRPLTARRGIPLNPVPQASVARPAGTALAADIHADRIASESAGPEPWAAKVVALRHMARQS